MFQIIGNGKVIRNAIDRKPFNFETREDAEKFARSSALDYLQPRNFSNTHRVLKWEVVAV